MARSKSKAAPAQPSAVILQFPPERVFRPTGNFAEINRSHFATLPADSLFWCIETQLEALRAVAGFERWTRRHDEGAVSSAETLALLALEFLARAKGRNLCGSLNREHVA
jgi:hypothetical protein